MKVATLVFNLGRFRVNFEYDPESEKFTHFHCSVLNGSEIRSVSSRLEPTLDIKEVVQLLEALESNLLLKERLAFVKTIPELRDLLHSTINGYLTKKRRKK